MIVKRITYNDTKPFILGIHYARRMPVIQYAYGLFDNDSLIGIVTYGQQLHRLYAKELPVKKIGIMY